MRRTATCRLIAADDRGGLHRPEGQGRLLPLSRATAARVEGSDRPQHRRIPAGRQGRISPERRRRGQGSAPRCSRRRARSAATPGACSARRWPMRRRSCRRSPTTSPRVDAGDAARLQLEMGSLRADRPARRRLARGPLAARRAWRCRRCSRRRATGRSTACRTAGGNFSAWMGDYRDIVRPEGVLLLEDVKLAVQAVAEERAPPRSGISATALLASSSPAR